MHQLTSTVAQNAQSAAQADAQAVQVRESVDTRSRSMHEAVATVEALQTSTRRINDAVGVIDHIAFQTNLLALNAAVEAARAGEQGRGFAVVATEVRRLAQRCSDEARQIRELVEGASLNVSTGVQRIRATGQEMVVMTDQVRSVATAVTQISAASSEQSAGLGQISFAAGQAAVLQERADALSNSVAGFRLRQGTAAEALEMVARAQAAAKGRAMQAFLDHLTDAGNGLCDRDLYVFALDRLGRYLAFAGNAAKVNTRVHDVPGIDGQALIDAIVRQADQEPGWVEYDITNPALGTVQTKMPYVLRIGPLYLGCGVYKSIAA